MESSLNNEANETLELADQSGKIRKVYMNSCGMETITYTREDLRSHSNYSSAIKELQDWLQKYSKDSDVAELSRAVRSAVEKAKK